MERTIELSKANELLKKEIVEHEKAKKELKNYEMLFSQIADLPYICDTKGNILFVNHTFKKLTGHKPEEFLGKPFASLFDEENLKKAMDAYTRTLQGESQQFELTFKDTGILCEYKNLPLRDEAGNVSGVIGTARDITERKRMEDLLRETNQTLRAIIQASPLAIVVLDPEGHVKMWNPSAEIIFGWREQDVLGHFLPIVPEDKQDEFRTLRERVLRGESFTGVEVQRQRKDGSPIDISLSTAPMYNSHGNVVGIVGIVSDITERIQMINALRQTNDFLDTILTNTKDIILIMDQEYKIEYMNHEAARTFGHVRGKFCYLSVCKKETPCQQCSIKEVLNGQTLRNERNIQEKVYDSIIVPFISSNKKISKMEILRDITERKQLQNELERLSITDKLTGLYNRRYFDESMEKEVLRAKRFKHNLCLLFIDIDKFKHLNDTYGHDAGDSVLRYLGKLIKEYVRNGIDIPCRYGGEEFTVLLPEAVIHDAVTISERILVDFGNKKFPVSAKNEQIRKTISIGVSELGSSDDAKTLLIHADKAMYEAKKTGGNSVCKYQA